MRTDVRANWTPSRQHGSPHSRTPQMKGALHDNKSRRTTARDRRRRRSRRTPPSLQPPNSTKCAGPIWRCAKRKKYRPRSHAPFSRTACCSSVASKRLRSFFGNRPSMGHPFSRARRAAWSPPLPVTLQSVVWIPCSGGNGPRPSKLRISLTSTRASHRGGGGGGAGIGGVSETPAAMGGWLVDPYSGVLCVQNFVRGPRCFGRSR